MSDPTPDKPSYTHLVLGGVIAIALAAAGGILLVQSRRQANARVDQGRTATGLQIYGELPEFRFTSHRGTPVGSADFAGRPWVANFVFTRCSGTCPQLSKSMASLQGALGDDSVRLVSFTCDPEYDTPARLAEYAKRYGANGETWLFVTGAEREIQDFSRRALKLALKRATPEELARGAERVIHSNKLVLIDAQLQIRGYYDGTDPAAVEQLARDYRELVKE